MQLGALLPTSQKDVSRGYLAVHSGLETDWLRLFTDILQVVI
jgi:hypothetical protein